MVFGGVVWALSCARGGQQGSESGAVVGAPAPAREPEVAGPAAPAEEHPAPAREPAAPAAGETSGGKAVASGAAVAGSPWSSPEACLAQLTGRPRRAAAAPRLASFNVRWFPDGKPGKKPSERGTDLEWLGCVLASLEVDAIAVQEFKTLPRAAESLKTVLGTLDRLSHGRWQAAFDDCPTPATQHVGILHDTSRVTASGARTLAELNPHGEKCKDTLRPGFEQTLTWPQRAPLRFVSVHFKSESDARSLGLRDRSFQTLGELFSWRDGRAVVAGDLNTMGCSSCTPELPGPAERGARGALLAAEGAALLPLAEGCTYYYRGAAQLLDGFVLSQPLRGAQASVAGPCAEAACQHSSGKNGVERSRAHHDLSDHCPLVLELPR